MFVQAGALFICIPKRKEIMDSKIYIGTVAALVWIGAIVMKHYWPDLDTGAIILACGSVLSGLGVYHVATQDAAPPAPPAQGVLASPGMYHVTTSDIPVNNSADKQGGFAVLTLLIIIAGIAGMLGLTGCASIEFAGHASYTVTPTPDGRCCIVTVRDGKEFASRDITIVKTGDDYAINIKEGESKAFPGQAIAAKALTVLPVTNLQSLIPVK